MGKWRLIDSLRLSWRQWRCDHNWQWEANIYGDEINRISLRVVYRSWWSCIKCGKVEPREVLVEDDQRWRGDIRGIPPEALE